MNSNQFQPKPLSINLTFAYFSPDTPEDIQTSIIDSPEFPEYLRTLIKLGSVTRTQALTSFSIISTVSQTTFWHDRAFETAKECDKQFNKEKSGLILPTDNLSNSGNILKM